MSNPTVQTTSQELSQLIQAGWRLIALESFEEDRALRLLERVASACDRRLIVWSTAAGWTASGKPIGTKETAGPGGLDAGLRAMTEIEEPALLVILDFRTPADEGLAIRRLRDWLPLGARRKQSVIMLGPVIELPIELIRETGRVSLPLPKANELDKLFRRVFDPGEDPATEAALEAAVRAALGLTGAEAVRVLRKACQATGGLNATTANFIVAEKRMALERTPALSFIDVEGGLDQVGGLGELKRWLRERRRAFGSEARKFGLPLPRGLLLLGVQGCGKSLSAKSVAREWQFPLLRLDLASVFSGGELSPEAAIREATAVAESIAPAVLWIDEIEKGFHDSAGDGNTARVFGSFLTWLAEKSAPVFVVATANDVANLPPELLRRGRFDELFFVDLPTVEERIEILSIHLAQNGRDPMQFPLEQLAQESERLSGAELAQIVASGLYRAFAEGRDLNEADLASAINETFPLYDTYEDRIKELRNWARTRARLASIDARMADLFDQ